MRRSAGLLALILSLCCALAGAAAGKGRATSASKGKKHTVSGRDERGRGSKRSSRRKRPPAPPPMPTRLEVLSIDARTGSMRVGLVMSGPAHPPETRIFVLTDERGRRFVPATAECTSSDLSAAEKAQATGVTAQDLPPVHWQCELSIAPIYRRAALTGVSMEWGDRAVSALPGQVRARWAEGPTSTPTAPPAAEKPQPETGPPAPTGEGEPSVSTPSGEDDEETEPE